MGRRGWSNTDGQRRWKVEWRVFGNGKTEKDEEGRDVQPRRVEERLGREFQNITL
jgi:hypothetical protein